MKNFILLTMLFLSGCMGLKEPLVAPPDASIKVYVVDDTLLEADKAQLKAIIKSRHIQLAHENDFDSYKLLIKNINHHSRDLYSDMETHNLYITLNSAIEAEFSDRQRGEFLWDKTLKVQTNFSPNAHYYSDKEWAKAELIWDQQRILFNQLIDEVIKSWKKDHPTGN
jgi:predicted small lipoprotein YifL